MFPRELAAQALGVHEGTIRSIEPIKHGLTNESWLVRTPDDAVVVRISSRHGDSLQIDRASEAAVLQSAAAAGISPPVLACDLERGILVTRYLGPVCTFRQLSQPPYIERLGRVFRTLHALAAPAHVREVHLPTLISGYLETLQTLHRDCALVESRLRARALAMAQEIADSCVPRLCHNDVHHLNVIDGEALRLIDWEYSGRGEPFFDLASVCVYHRYTPSQRERLLGAYLDAPGGQDMDRLGTCCWLFEYVRDLWAQVRAAVEDGSGGVTPGPTRLLLPPST